MFFKFDDSIRALIPKLSLRAQYKDFGVVAESQVLEVRREESKEVPAVDQSQPKSVTAPTSGNSQEAVNSWRLAAYIWEYRYLNYFLRGNTQRALDTLYVANQKIPLGLASTILAGWAPDKNEQQAILAAMSSHHLVEAENDLIGLTPKGREYVEFRGAPKPNAVPAKQA